MLAIVCFFIIKRHFFEWDGEDPPSSWPVTIRCLPFVISATVPTTAPLHAMALCHQASSWSNRNFHHTIPPLSENAIAVEDVLQGDTVSKKRGEINSLLFYDFHETSHPFFASWT